MTFTASNGLMVERTLGGLPRVIGEGWSSQLTDPETVALREFFRHERDEELGRWRWTENPDFVVYPSRLYTTPGDPDVVHVVNEANGQSHRVHRDDPESLFGRFSDAGHAYFDAHPAPKPWHDAKVNEAWELTANGDTGPFLVATAYPEHERLQFVASNGTRFEIDDGEQITAGRRIWPEVSS